MFLCISTSDSFKARCLLREIVSNLRYCLVILRQPAAQYQLSRRLDFIHSSERSGVRRVVEQLGLGLGFFRDLDQGIGEAIQCVFVFSFGRFDHQRFVDDEREVVCGRMETVIH